MRRGITGRWLVNTFGVILAIVVFLVVVLSLFMKGYYYNGIHQTLNGRVDELSNVIGNYSKEYFDVGARGYVENFSDKESMEMMIINWEGKIVITSTGFPPDNTVDMPDYKIAINKKSEGYGFWQGIQNDEHIMAVTKIIYDTAGDSVGAIRYCVSLEPADRQIFVMIMFMILVGMSILFFVLLSGAYFVRSIVRPIQEINDVSKRIAQGDFEARLERRNNDEIGELCDSIP